MSKEQTNGQLLVVSGQLPVRHGELQYLVAAVRRQHSFTGPMVLMVERGTATLRDTELRITSDFGASVRNHEHGQNRRMVRT